MTEKGTGAVILAAGKSEYMEELRPLMKVGQTTMIQREIDTLRQAGISPIVVVTGYQAEALEKHIAHRGAVFVRNKRYQTSQMFDSIGQGLRYIQKKAARVLLFPSDIPLVSADTILKMKEAKGISYSKGWKMVKQAEDELGIRFIARQTGGSRGGSSTLTEEGAGFLDRFRALEAQIARYASDAFSGLFSAEEELNGQE